MNHRLCICEYRNPIEFVCTLKDCPDQRLICKSCAWDHKQHDSKVLQIKEFENIITNDSLVQRIQDVQNAEGINNSIEQLIHIAQVDIIQIVKKRCIELKDKIKKSHNPFHKAVDHIADISKKCYTSWTIDSLVKELDISDIQGQLQRREAAQFQKFSLICKEILILSDALDKLRIACQAEASLELQSIRIYISQNLEFKESKQRSLCAQDFNDIKKPVFKQEKQPIIWSSQILNQNLQQEQVQQNYQKAPKHMHQSHLHIINQPKELQEKALPYNNGRLKSECTSSQAQIDQLFFSENKSRKCLFLDQTQEKLKNQSNFYSNTDRLLSQSLYESSKKKS